MAVRRGRGTLSALPETRRRSTSRIVSIADAKAPARRRGASTMRYCPPRLVEPLIARPRIARRMAEAAGKVTLIVGPPGSGKTSALASHHADLVAAGMAVRWLTLSAEDNDPAVLRRHLDHAFRGEGAEGREEGEGLSDPPGNIVGFIDGLEKIDAAPARDLIGAFVLELPPSSSFHITAHRMQGALFHDGWLRGVVEVIGPDELRMTDDEAALLLGEAWSPWDRQRINEAVDGWAAGLRFVGRAPRSADRLLDGAGERPFPVEMANYLDDVVCARMDPVALAALMEVSVLDRFTPRRWRRCPAGRAIGRRSTTISARGRSSAMSTSSAAGQPSTRCSAGTSASGCGASIPIASTRSTASPPPGSRRTASVPRRSATPSPSPTRPSPRASSRMSARSMSTCATAPTSAWASASPRRGRASCRCCSWGRSISRSGAGDRSRRAPRWRRRRG
ncbi:hypothetical protein ACFSTI_11640 [Rhizorhabdus histidinilytica]